MEVLGDNAPVEEVGGINLDAMVHIPALLEIDRRVLAVERAEGLEQRLKDLESQFTETKNQLDKITLEWSEASAKTTTLMMKWW